MMLVAVLLVAVLLGIGILFLNSTPKEKPSDELVATQAERDDLEALVTRLHRMAQDNSIIDPALASMIMGEIEQYRREKRR